MVHLHPLLQQELGLIMQAGRIIELTGLRNARVHHGRRAARRAIQEAAVVLLADRLHELLQSMEGKIVVQGQ